MNSYDILRPLIYRLTPEQAHATTLALLRLAGALPPARWLLDLWFRPRRSPEPVRVFGLDFPNPIGLAAGYDKDGLGWRGLACLGFGHLELGTVTPRPQPGNPLPRVFRLVQDEAVINRMGFPGRGAQFMARRLEGRRLKRPTPGPSLKGGEQNLSRVSQATPAKHDTESKRGLSAATAALKPLNNFSPSLQGGGKGVGSSTRSMSTPVIVGVNIGKNKSTPLEEAASDYLSLFETLAPLADYLAVNVSSPNTPGLRTLQTRQALEGLLGPLAAARAAFTRTAGRHVPLLVKLAPDLDDDELDDALEAVLGCAMDGIIQGNTTIQRGKLVSPLSGETGGLSGSPLEPIALAALRRTLRRLDGRLPVVASGGVMDLDGARTRLDAGAVLVQLYTGLIYRGPGLVRQIVEGL